MPIYSPDANEPCIPFIPCKPLHSSLGIGPRGNGIYFCDKVLEYSEEGVYTAQKSDFVVTRHESIYDIRVGDVVLFRADYPGHGDVLCIGVVDNVSAEGIVTFHMYEDFFDVIEDGSITDNKLSNLPGQILDRVSHLSDDKIPWPSGNNSKHGIRNQVLRTNADGTTRWDYEHMPPEESMNESVRTWLDEHPEATTTVQDGSLTEPKLSSALSLEICRCFDIVEDMQEAADLKVGMTCHTNGYYMPNDDGAAYYIVTDNALANNKDIIRLQNNLFAVLVIDKYVAPEQLGARGDGLNDDLDILSYCISTYDRVMGKKTYLISSTLVIQDLSYKDVQLEKIKSQSTSAAIHVKKSSYGNIRVNKIVANDGYGVYLIPDNNERNEIAFSTFTFNYIQAQYTCLTMDDDSKGYLDYCSVYGYQFRTLNTDYSIVYVHSTKTNQYWCNQINFYNIWFCIGKNVYLDNCDNISFINCGFEGISDTGVVFDNARTCKITDCRIENIANNIFSFKRNAYNNVISGVPAFKFNKVDTSELDSVQSNYVYNALYDNSNNPIAIKGRTTYFTKAFAPLPNNILRDFMYLTQDKIVSNDERLYTRFQGANNVDVSLTLSDIYTFDGINKIIVNNTSQRIKVYDSHNALIFDGTNHDAKHYLIMFINSTATSNLVTVLKLEDAS